MLSGFLVGSSGLRWVEKRTWSLPRYLLHRFLRLEIVLLPALLLELIWDAAGMHIPGAAGLYSGGWHLIMRWGPADLSWRTLLGNAAFVQGILVPSFGVNGALWSLANEFWYYVLFGLLVTACLRSTRWWLRILVSALILAVSKFVGLGIMILAPLWFLGLGIYLLPQMRLSALGRRVLLISTMLLFAVFLVLEFGAHVSSLSISDQRVLDLATGVLFSLVLYAMVQANPISPRYRRVAHWIAAPTYTLYANHLPALFFLLACIGARKAPTPAHCLEVFAWFIVVWFYGYGLYMLFERRTPAIRKWIESRLFPAAAR